MLDESNETVAESSMEVDFLEDDGWSTLEATLKRDGEAMSQFAIEVYVSKKKEELEERRRVGLAWDLGGGIGWGVLGLSAALALLERDVLAVPLKRVHSFDMTQAQRDKLEPCLREGAKPKILDYPVVHSLGRWGLDGSLGTMDKEIWSEKRNIALLFAENKTWTTKDLDVLDTFDSILVGSTWCATTLRHAALLERRKILAAKVDIFMQGVDTTTFFPAAKSTSEVFTVFSGGKLELRKGHDIVIAAYKAFRAMLPPETKVRLCVSWVNLWRQSLETLKNATYTLGLPEKNSKAEEAIANWIAKNGIAKSEILSLPALAHSSMAKVLKSIDVAVFPNRIEGGTNLVAMETAASGVPIVLSENTGHLDLIRALKGTAYVLHNQSLQQDGGAHSDPIEAAHNLADVFFHRNHATTRAATGAHHMRHWTWPTAVDTILQAAFPLLLQKGL